MIDLPRDETINGVRLVRLWAPPARQPGDGHARLSLGGVGADPAA
jgi:hypothetical protein